MSKHKHILFVYLLIFRVLLCGAEPVKKPLAFYLKNLPIERVGEYSDAKIKAGLLSDGFIVIDVDCSDFPRTSPELEDALVRFHKNCASIYTSYEDSTQVVDLTRVFYVPQGYTVTCDIPVWNTLEHGASGSSEWVMDTWNSYIVPRFGVAEVSVPDQMHNRDGSPLDWNLYMDIIHPSGKASKRVPLLMIFGSITPRMASFRPDRSLDRVYRSIFPLGFLTSGYAVAVTDHGYNPLVSSWGHFTQYTLDDFNANASSSAFIRYVRAHQDLYNLDGRVGTMGISKASYSSVRVADKNNALGDESLLFGGVINEKPQPWQGVDSHADVVYAAAGIGAERVFRYVGEHTAPMITSAGMYDEYRQWEVYPEVVRFMSSVDNPHLSFWMEDMGHTFPCMGEDQATGVSRYVLFKRFFDHFLKSSSADALFVLPKENASDVDVYGRTRVIPENENLPKGLPLSMLPSAIGYFHQAYPFAGSYAGMLMRLATGEQKYVVFRDFYERYIAHAGEFVVLASDRIFPVGLPELEAYAPVTIRFLEEYSLAEISEKVRIVNMTDGSSVPGTWTVFMKGTCFTFTPEDPMISGVSYRIIIPSTVRSLLGGTPSNTVMRDFTVNIDNFVP